MRVCQRDSARVCTCAWEREREREKARDREKRERERREREKREREERESGREREREKESIEIVDLLVVIVYGVALVSRIDKITGLFCKRVLQKRRYSAKETYNLIDPTNCIHPIAL